MVTRPPWLLSRQDWPQWVPTNVLLQLIEDDDDTPSTTQGSDENVAGIHNVVNITRYSSIGKLVAVTAYVLRYIHNSRKQQPLLNGPLTATELNSARKLWISSSQSTSYATELTYLLKKQGSCPNVVRQLRLYLDQDNLIRCGGRIHNAPLDQCTKFPHLLPPRHPLTTMIIQETHKKLHHGGTAITMTALRQVYWIPTIRQWVRSILKCVACARAMGKPYGTPNLPPLPKTRVGSASLFAVTGVDFTGTLYVKEPIGECKAYICLFT